MRLTLALSIKLFGAAVVIGFVTAIGIMQYAMDTLKINGPLYHQIVNGKDLVADILPPPMFVVESYMLAGEIAEDTGLFETHAKRLGELESEYRGRVDYWAKSDLSPNFKSYIANDLVPATESFWTEIKTGYLPAVKSGDAEVVKQHLRTLRGLYRAQKASVEKLVTMANDALARAEDNGRSTASFYEIAALGMAIAVVIGMVFGVWYSNRRSVVAITGLKDYMARLASGDYATKVPFIGRKDEIGDMAAAVDVFRTRGIEKLQLESDNRRQMEMTEA
jgi:methyl-accepting chemotaxis protein